MDKRLEQIKKIFEIEFEVNEKEIWIAEADDLVVMDFFGEISFSIIEDEIAVSFYSNAHPVHVANYIKALHAHKVVDFIVYENMYPIIENGKFIEMLFGDEADERYVYDLVEARAKTKPKELTNVVNISSKVLH